MGILAWVFYIDGLTNKHRFEELKGTDGYNSTIPKDWGLNEKSTVLLVLQSNQHLNSWIIGNMTTKLPHQM